MSNLSWHTLSYIFSSVYVLFGIYLRGVYTRYVFSTSFQQVIIRDEYVSKVGILSLGVRL